MLTKFDQMSRVGSRDRHADGDLKNPRHPTCAKKELDPYLTEMHFLGGFFGLFLTHKGYFLCFL